MFASTGHADGANAVVEGMSTDNASVELAGDYVGWERIHFTLPVGLISEQFAYEGYVVG